MRSINFDTTADFIFSYYFEPNFMIVEPIWYLFDKKFFFKSLTLNLYFNFNFFFRLIFI